MNQANQKVAIITGGSQGIGDEPGRMPTVGKAGAW